MRINLLHFKGTLSSGLRGMTPPFKRTRAYRGKIQHCFLRKGTRKWASMKKILSKWALNFFLHLNAHFTYFSSVLIEHILLCSPYMINLYLLFLRHNNDFKKYIYSIGCSYWANGHKITQRTHFYLSFYFLLSFLRERKYLRVHNEI